MAFSAFRRGESGLRTKNLVFYETKNRRPPQIWPFSAFRRGESALRTKNLVFYETKNPPAQGQRGVGLGAKLRYIKENPGPKSLPGKTVKKRLRKRCAS